MSGIFFWIQDDIRIILSLSGSYSIEDSHRLIVMDIFVKEKDIALL